MLRCDGIYRSLPISWKESHGGAHWSGVSVQFWRFYPNNRWLRSISENHNLPFWRISEERPAAPSGPVVQEGVTGGSYSIAGNLLRILELSPAPLGPKWLTYEWMISGERLIPHEPHLPGHVELSFGRA